MNRELVNYLDRHGNETVGNRHLMFINELLANRNSADWGALYKLSNQIYKNIRNKETKTLKELAESIYRTGNER